MIFKHFSKQEDLEEMLNQKEAKVLVSANERRERGHESHESHESHGRERGEIGDREGGDDQ